jgi:hypothetical protein
MSPGASQDWVCRTIGAHSKPYAMPVATESTVMATGHERRWMRSTKPRPLTFRSEGVRVDLIGLG